MPVKLELDRQEISVSGTSVTSGPRLAHKQYALRVRLALMDLGRGPGPSQLSAQGREPDGQRTLAYPRAVTAPGPGPGAVRMSADGRSTEIMIIKFAHANVRDLPAPSWEP